MQLQVQDNTIQGVVYSELKRNILSLNLIPGKEMSTQEVATAMNVSRTPVREAFIRLQRENLVETFPQRGTFVSKINLKRVEQERFIREGLEIAVAKPFLDNCSKKHIELLKHKIEEQYRSYEDKDYALFVELDNQFHELFFDVAEQALAWKTLLDTNAHYSRIRVLTVSNDKTISGVIEQHKRIIEIIERKDLSALQSELSDHITKINFEKVDLLKQYPDYFARPEEVDTKSSIDLLRASKR